MRRRFKALTIDFWNTIADAHSRQAERALRRHKHIIEVLRLDTDSQMDRRLQHVEQMVVLDYEEQRIVDMIATNADDMLSRIWPHLDARPDDAEHRSIVRFTEGGMLAVPPSLVPNVGEILPRLANEYQLAIISDTLFSPGEAIRSYLERIGLLRYFSSFVFSDETGVVKPHKRAFHQALEELDVAPHETVHIGDLVRTDIQGAKLMGMGAVRYVGAWDDPNKGALPDAILEDWLDLPDLLDRMPESRQERPL